MNRRFKELRRSFFPFILVFTLTIPGCTGSQTSQLSYPSEQLEILAVLTGHKEINTGTKLSDRASEENRALARDYLFMILRDTFSSVKRHKYSETGENVYAEIPSTNGSDEFIVLGAHFDSVPGCPGANDNGSGVALMFSVAKKLAAGQNRTKNILLVFFDEEEKGLIGSRFFAQKLADDGVNVHSVHTADQVGWDNDGDRAIELEVPYDGITDLYKGVSKNQFNDLPIHTTNVTSTDHTSFRRLGFSAVGITEEYKNKDTTPHYHKATDTYETINFDYLHNATELVTKVLEKLIK